MIDLCSIQRADLDGGIKMTDQKKHVETKAVLLGASKRVDLNTPQAEILISSAMLNARQEAIGESRKYAGPVSDEKLEVLAEDINATDVEPTECLEYAESEK